MGLHHFITALKAYISIYIGEILKIIHGSSKTKKSACLTHLPQMPEEISKIRISVVVMKCKFLNCCLQTVSTDIAPVFEMSTFLRTTILAGPKEVNLEQRPSGGYNIGKIIKAADHERNR